MIQTIALSALRQYFCDNITVARYKVGSAYYTAPIEEKTILPDGRISVTFLIDHTVAGNITVTEVQLMNHNGTVWVSKAESITRKDTQEGILYRFRFTIVEEG